jgi:hypothetical protein
MSNMQRKSSRHFGLFLLLLAVPSLTPAASSAASNLMSQAMLSMMDAMGNLAQEYNRNRSWSSGGYSQPFYNWQAMQPSPWNLYAMPGGVPGQQQLQDLMQQAPAAASSAQQAMQGISPQTTDRGPAGQQLGQGATDPSRNRIVPSAGPVPMQSALDGIWQGRGGEVVLVMYGHFRIYADADHYRDGMYQINDNLLILHDPQTGHSRTYEYAYDEGRMVLRDEAGQLLLYRQLPIPIPPYSIFSGQQQTSVEQQSPPNQE